MNPDAPSLPAPPDAAAQQQYIHRYRQGDYAALLAEATALTRQLPEHPFGWKLLGVVAQRLGRRQDALAAKRRAAELLPQDAEAQNNFGNALCTLGRHEEAVTVFARAITLRPDFAEAHNNLGISLQYIGRLDEARAQFQQALAARPDFAAAHSNLLFMLSHDATQTGADLLQAHREFDRRHGEPLRAAWQPHANARDPHKRLRVGFVSGDLRRHAVAHFLLPIWRALDRGQLAIHAYHTDAREDAVSAELRTLTDGWTRAAALSDEQLAQAIRDDGIDILFDLAGHTRHNRLLVFARKPAPVQVTAIGYPNTTGLAAMDYRIADRFRLTPELARLQVEQVVLIPCSSTFEHPVAPPPGPLPALVRGALTFGSFQRGTKITAGTLALWARVLNALPGSRLLIGAMDDPANRRRVGRALTSQGIAVERLLFHGRRPMADYLALHDQIDLMLDTYPYPGGTTTNHALWMGVPTLTRTGDSVVSTQSAATLRRLGLDDFVSASDDELVQRALHWSANLPALAAVRAGLRERIESSALLRPATVAAGMQAAMRGMWQRWCAGLPPAAFEVTL